MPATNTLDFSSAASAEKALKKVSQLMMRAGQPVVSTEFSDKPSRTNGVTYREASLTLASGQLVALRVNATGDIFQVLLNGSVKPIKAHDDTVKAVGEIAGMAEKNQVAFQKAQARIPIALPKGMSAPAPKIEAALTERVALLDAQIAERQATVADLQQQLWAMVDSLPPRSELDDVAKEVLSQLLNGAVEDGDLICKLGRDKLVDAKLVARDDGANWLTKEGEKLAAALLDAAPLAPQASQPLARSWHDFKIVDQAFVDEAGPMPLPSTYQVRDRVSIYVAEDTSVKPLDAIVIAARFTHAKVHYTLAVAIQGTEADPKYAVLHDIDSISVTARGEAMLDSGQRPDIVADLSAHQVPVMLLAGAYVAAREIVQADPSMLDNAATAGAVEQLRQALFVVETNAPINEAEGNLDQAKLERSLAESFRTAIGMLDGAGVVLTDAGLAELVSIAALSAAEDTDIKDQDALAQLLALGLVETAEGLYMATGKGKSALDDAGYDAYGEPYAASED